MWNECWHSNANLKLISITSFNNSDNVGRNRVILLSVFYAKVLFLFFDCNFA